MLIKLIEECRSEETFNVLWNKLKNIHNDVCDNKEKYIEVVNKVKDGDYVAYIFGNKYCSIRPYLYPLKPGKKNRNFDKFDKAPFIKFIRNEKVITSSKDAMDLYIEYKNDEKCFIFLDPPYYLDGDSKMFKGMYPNCNFAIHHNSFDHIKLAEMLKKH